MGNINLYQIDNEKVERCLENLNASSLEMKNTLSSNIKYKGEDYHFETTLYLEQPRQTDEQVSWNWILNEFEQQLIYTSKAPKAVLMINETVGEVNKYYAVTFGSAYFSIDKFCDRDFGFCFASRIRYTSVKTTALTAPNLTRRKIVNTYVNCNELDFNSGESFAKLKVNADLREKFTQFKPTLEIGSSIRFNIENESVAGILNVILYVEEILQISSENITYKIPLFQSVKDKELLLVLNQRMDEILVDKLLNNGDVPLLAIPELEIIGTDEFFNRTDDEFELRYLRAKRIISVLTFEEVTQFCSDKAIDTIDKINKIKIVRRRDGESVVMLPLRNFVEYTDDMYKCVFSGGKWYSFNRDYLAYLNDSIREITCRYNPEYDFNESIHNSFIDSKYENEKHETTYSEKDDSEIRKTLKHKYYAERCFNLLREQEGSFENYDRVETTNGFERMDLYEIETKTMFAVKIGKASSDLCYAVDQSLTALKKLKHDEISNMPPIQKVGLWLILERNNSLPTFEDGTVDLCSLDMLMLKNRIDQWKKEVRLAGYQPIIYINYRNLTLKGKR